MPENSTRRLDQAIALYRYLKAGLEMLDQVGGDGSAQVDLLRSSKEGAEQVDLLRGSRHLLVDSMFRLAELVGVMSPHAELEAPPQAPVACQNPRCRQAWIATAILLDALKDLDDVLDFGASWTQGVSKDADAIARAFTRARSAIAYATTPIQRRRTCPWCHALNVVGDEPTLCPHCGHRADVGRLDCNCDRCRLARKNGG